MKRTDIFTIIAVTLVGIIVSASLVNLLLGDPNQKSVTFKSVEVVEAALAQPDPEVFNPDAINPTVEVYVGECIDRDQDGQLNQAELIACGRVDGSVELPSEEAESEPEEEPVEEQTEEDLVDIMQESMTETPEEDEESLEVQE